MSILSLSTSGAAGWWRPNESPTIVCGRQLQLWLLVGSDLCPRGWDRPLHGGSALPVSITAICGPHGTSSRHEDVKVSWPGHGGGVCFIYRRKWGKGWVSSALQHLFNTREKRLFKSGGLFTCYTVGNLHTTPWITFGSEKKVVETYRHGI